METLCHHCSALFPLATKSQGPVTHHLTVGALAQSAQTCPLCRKIQDRWSLPYLQGRFPEIEGTEESGALPLTWKVANPDRSASGAEWLLLIGEITVAKRKFSASFEITITTCAPESGLLSSIAVNHKD